MIVVDDDDVVFRLLCLFMTFQCSHWLYSYPKGAVLSSQCAWPLLDLWPIDCFPLSRSSR